MKLKTCLLLIGFISFTSVFALNVHKHPSSPDVEAKSTQNAKSPGYCEIEIINDSNHSIDVYGTFDDSSSLAPFTIYPYENPHYIDLLYNGSCHSWMQNLTIRSPYQSAPIYSRETYAGSSIRVNYLNKQDQVKILSK